MCAELMSIDGRLERPLSFSTAIYSGAAGCKGARKAFVAIINPQV